jgi:hypothetical protein
MLSALLGRGRRRLARTMLRTAGSKALWVAKWAALFWGAVLTLADALEMVLQELPSRNE